MTTGLGTAGRWEEGPQSSAWVGAAAAFHGAQAALGQAGHVEARDRRKRERDRKECVCFRPLRLECDPAYPEKEDLVRVQME